MGKRAASLFAVWFGVTGAAVVAPACYGHNCDGLTGTFGANAGEGELLDDNTWESSPVDGTWIDFSRQRAWIFNLHALGNRKPDIVTAYVSAQQNPFNEGGQFAQAAGNLAEIWGATNGTVTVHNGTCADYFVRVVVQSAPAPTDTPPPANDDAGASDAATD